MCTRYSLRAPSVWKKYVYQHAFEEFSELRLVPRFNIAPSQNVMVIKRDRESGNNVPAAARWGFVPHWQRGTPSFRPVNARDDKLLESRMFRESFDRRRCLVPADGFYEWLEVEKVKQPFFFQLADEAPFAFAGFYDTWHDPETDETADRMTFCTTAPTPFMRRFHDRMVVMLRTEEEWNRWLAPNLSGEDVFDLLLNRPAAGELAVHAVSRSMGNSRHESPDNVEPVPFDINALPEMAESKLRKRRA